MKIKYVRELSFLVYVAPERTKIESGTLRTHPFTVHSDLNQKTRTGRDILNTPVPRLDPTCTCFSFFVWPIIWVVIPPSSFLQTAESPLAEPTSNTENVGKIARKESAT
jgi:hypothetical protein